MKKLLVIIVIFISTISKPTQAQNFGVPDTLSYLQSIVNNKAQFIGQPFSVLKDSLKIQIKFFRPFAGVHYNKNQETSTSFAFYFPQSVDDLYLTYPRLDISWYPYLNINQSDLLHTQYRAVGWCPAIATFYSTGIISDIRILK